MRERASTRALAAAPDWSVVARETGVYLTILWEEYREPDDKVFVDYSGKKVPIIDPITGVAREAEIFVGVLGTSDYTYAEAT